MTVEERVKDVMGRLMEMVQRATRPYSWNKETERFVEWTDEETRRFVIQQIVLMGRQDAIEDAAKVTDELRAQLIADEEKFAQSGGVLHVSAAFRMAADATELAGNQIRALGKEPA